MSSKDNVLNITDRLIERRNRDRANEKSSNDLTQKTSKVESIADLRAQIISEERRQVKRTILTEFIGAFAIIPGSGLVKLALHDISDTGLSFDVEEKFGKFNEGDEVALRVYLNQETYFPIIINVANCRLEPSEGSYRHGGSFVKDSVNQVALHHFIKFIETVSTSLRADLGDLMLSKPKK